MDDGTWDGEEPPEGLPAAPVPRHERAWRHPSELGRTDRAVESRTLGRGVLAVAGLTGVAMSLVLGRALIPDRDHPGVPRSVVSAATGLVAETASPGPVATTDPPDESAPLPAGNPATDIIAIDGAGGPLVGVVWGDGQHSITAAAVGEPGEMCVVALSDGRRVEAVVVGSDSGLAMLELSTPGPPAQLSATWPPLGDLHFTASDGTAVSAPFPAAPGATIGLPDGLGIVAGTAVVDDAGHLVGLGIPDADGWVRLVPVTSADGMIERATRLGAWLGVKSGTGPEGASSIAELAPHAPAEAAGLQIGDVIMAIDGDDVQSLRDLRARLRVVAPGAVVDLTVRRDDAVLVVSVTTTSRPSQIGEPNSG